MLVGRHSNGWGTPTTAEQLIANDIEAIKQLFDDFAFTILGLKKEEKNSNTDVDGLMQLILELRADVRNRKDFATSDKIRDQLAGLGIRIKDEKGGVSWFRE